MSSARDPESKGTEGEVVDGVDVGDVGVVVPPVNTEAVKGVAEAHDGLPARNPEVLDVAAAFRRATPNLERMGNSVFRLHHQEPPAAGESGDMATEVHTRTKAEWVPTAYMEGRLDEGVVYPTAFLLTFAACAAFSAPAAIAYCISITKGDRVKMRLPLADGGTVEGMLQSARIVSTGFLTRRGLVAAPSVKIDGLEDKSHAMRWYIPVGTAVRGVVDEQIQNPARCRRDVSHRSVVDSKDTSSIFAVDDAEPIQAEDVALEVELVGEDDRRRTFTVFGSVGSMAAFRAYTTAVGNAPPEGEDVYDVAAAHTSVLASWTKAGMACAVEGTVDMLFDMSPGAFSSADVFPRSPSAHLDAFVRSALVGVMGAARAYIMSVDKMDFMYAKRKGCERVMDEHTNGKVAESVGMFAVACIKVLADELSVGGDE